MQEENEKPLTRKVVAVRLGVSVWTIDRWRKSGKLPEPVVSDYRAPRWTLDQIQRWLQDVRK
jgi:predicted DNA-binding transcriptional regulator AlpA